MDTVFAGLDWASRTHAVCVIDERGGVCKQWDVSHDADGLRELMRQLHALHVTHIAIERPSGCLLYTSPSPRDRTRSRMPSSA